MNKLTIAQRVRLLGENYPFILLLLFALTCPTFLVAFTLTLNILFAKLLILSGFVWLLFLVWVTFSTDKWWYEEYPDNEWGEHREYIAKMEKLLAELKR